MADVTALVQAWVGGSLANNGLALVAHTPSTSVQFDTKEAGTGQDARLEITLSAPPCSGDSVKSGTVCIDKYEASVWYVPPTQRLLITKIQSGTVKLTDLTSQAAVAAGVVQLGLAADDLATAGCPATGNGCVDVYAASIRGVIPAGSINWFQAAATARNSLKRLPTNQEWQVAAPGTPDDISRNVSSAGVANTGSLPACVSDVGAFDMVGNSGRGWRSGGRSRRLRGGGDVPRVGDWDGNGSHDGRRR